MTNTSGPIRFDVRRLESVDSTSDECKRLAAAGAPEGTVVTAQLQTAGRGRMGRHWISTPGDGLFLSIILRPRMPFDTLWQIGFAASVAAAETVTSIAGVSAAVKWPNDVLLKGKKITGILIEAGKASENPALIVGIGINVNNEEFPSDLSQPVTSIFLETKRRTELKDVEDALLSALNTQYLLCREGHFNAVLHHWKSMDATSGRRLTVRLPDGQLEGTALGIDDEGNLVLQNDDGTATRISAGEVLLHR